MREAGPGGREVAAGRQFVRGLVQLLHSGGARPAAWSARAGGQCRPRSQGQGDSGGGGEYAADAPESVEALQLSSCGTGPWVVRLA